MKILIRNVRIIDEALDVPGGTVLIEDGYIRDVSAGGGDRSGEALVIDGLHLGAPGMPVLMPAFVDLHAHFRDPGFPEKETLESASLAAVAGGYGTVVCMANTRPVLDTPQAVEALKARSDALGLIDLYPVMALTRGMEGKELSGLSDLASFLPAALPAAMPEGRAPRLLSEDGKDLADDNLFRAAFAQARRLGIPVSCHCDAGGDQAEAAKRAGAGRAVWSRIEENNATRRAIALGKEAGAPVHIAHVSTREAAAMIREEKAALEKTAPSVSGGGFSLSCEATPHHLALTGEDARALGEESLGRVNPPLRTGEDRRALAAAVLDGTIDAIATDHAPHSAADKAAGAPGFTGLETAFAVCLSTLVRPHSGPGPFPPMELRRLSSLMSAAPARILALPDRGRIAPGCRADLVLVDPGASWRVRPGALRSRGKNTPFAGRELWGKVLMTLHRGRVVFDPPRED